MLTHQETSRRPAASSPASKPALPSPVSQAVRHATQNGGQTLDKRTQNQMSARFGHDFSQVRIHTDTQAGEAAEALGANAFALGGDIVFGSGKYHPGSRETERLFAHELTHVVQQARPGPGDWDRTSAKSDASEIEADSIASQVMLGHSVNVQAAPGAAVARDPDDPSEPPPSQRLTPVPEEDIVRPGLKPVEGGDMPPGLENPVEIPGPPRLPTPGTMGEYDPLLSGAGGGAAEGAGAGAATTVAATEGAGAGWPRWERGRSCRWQARGSPVSARAWLWTRA